MSIIIGLKYKNQAEGLRHLSRKNILFVPEYNYAMINDEDNDTKKGVKQTVQVGRSIPQMSKLLGHLIKPEHSLCNPSLVFLSKAFTYKLTLYH
jgi:hypothetical protein